MINKKIKFKDFIQSNKIIILGIILVVFYLIFESIIDWYVFNINEQLYQDIITDNIHEQYAHFTITGLILFISIYSQKLISKQRKTQKKLSASEIKYRLLVEHAQEGILALDKKTNTKFVNQKMVEMLGYTEHDMLGKHLFDFMAEESAKLAKKFLESRRFGIKGQQHDFEFIRKDGKIVYAIVEIAPLLDESNYIGSIACVADITERKKAENIIKEELKNLEELDRVKNEFIYRASHELKTPLNSIIVASTILLKECNLYLKEKDLNLIALINKGGQRLKNLVDDLLDVIKIDVSEIELKLEKTHIPNLIKSCINDLRSFIIERNLKINFVPRENINAYVDKNRFEQVLINLIVNAIKNTHSKGEISIFLEKNDQILDIRIQDNGVGFTEHEKKLIFKKFGKIERSGKGMDISTEGSGLGLYITKKIVELHNGEVRVESEGRNKGSTLIIQLPINEYFQSQ